MAAPFRQAQEFAQELSTLPAGRVGISEIVSPSRNGVRVIEGAFDGGKGIYRRESVLLIAAALLAGGRPVSNSDVRPFNGKLPGIEGLTTITKPCRLIEINPVLKFHAHSGTKLVRSACC